MYLAMKSRFDKETLMGNNQQQSTTKKALIRAMETYFNGIQRESTRRPTMSNASERIFLSSSGRALNRRI